MIFLDIETQNIFTEQKRTTDHLKISYIGIIDEQGKKYDIWENDMDKLKKILYKGDIITGYNILYFDMPVIANYLGDKVNELPMLDLMVAAQKAVGFRPKLDYLANATLGYGKTGNGLDAVKYYANNELDKLKSYCLKDVKITKELYDYGEKKGHIKYFDRKGFAKKAKINWENGYSNIPENNSNKDNRSLFDI